jgi:sacsin
LKTFYNDIGENSWLVKNDEQFIAHQSLDEALARKLDLNRLGLESAELLDIGPNMGQAPLTTVRRALEQQYTDQQFLLEFLANAEDAKATEFAVALNLVTVRKEESDIRALCPAMAYLCTLPSLVVYNNAQFTSKDFDGICHTSLGGKEGREDTIGEFGLGVLTMYHFTDVSCVFFSLLSSVNVGSDAVAVGNGHLWFSCSVHGPLCEAPASYKSFSS